MSRIGGLVEKGYDHQSFNETDLQAVPGKLMPPGEQCIRKEMASLGEKAYLYFFQFLASGFKVKIAKSHLEKYCIWGTFRDVELP